MRDRQAQMRDACLEIILDAGERARRDRSVVGAARQIASDCGRAPDNRRRRGLELWSEVDRNLHGEVAYAVRADAPSAESIPRSPE
jgi:hypothetical protein